VIGLAERAALTTAPPANPYMPGAYSSGPYSIVPAYTSQAQESTPAEPGPDGRP
jgi:hypothetical protein